ncbi:MAG: TIGR03016 family PEP-CTERM system-associated outer membrane protein [Geobacter sp.]|nr:TIGR03016 family PEP-CTERM system-associated outer membrane protein [Geobacter sp.]
MQQVLFGTLLLLHLLPGESLAADYELKPRIAISEEYTDNVDESGTSAREEFITRAMPGFSLRYLAPRLDLTSSYNFDYRHYAKGTKGDEFTHNLEASSTLTIVENLFFLQASDTYKRVSLDVARDTTTESLFNNQSDQNVGTVSPYLVWRVGNNSTIKTGYRYTNTWYRESSGIDKREHYAFVDASHEVLPRFSFTWGYQFSDTGTSTQNYQRHNAYGGFRYEYADKSFLFGQAGNTWQMFDNGINVSNLFWNAGLTHEFPMVTLTLETRVQYTEDPLQSSIKETLYSGRLSRNFERGSLELSSGYSEYEITETGVIDRKKASVGASGRYEILDRTNLSLGLLGEKFSQRTVADYPSKSF